MRNSFDGCTVSGAGSGPCAKRFGAGSAGRHRSPALGLFGAGTGPIGQHKWRRTQRLRLGGCGPCQARRGTHKGQTHARVQHTQGSNTRKGPTHTRVKHTLWCAKNAVPAIVQCRQRVACPERSSEAEYRCATFIGTTFWRFARLPLHFPLSCFGGGSRHLPKFREPTGANTGQTYRKLEGPGPGHTGGGTPRVPPFGSGLRMGSQGGCTGTCVCPCAQVPCGRKIALHPAADGPESGLAPNAPFAGHLPRPLVHLTRGARGRVQGNCF